MNFYIQKQTPASGWYTIHRNLSLAAAQYILADIAKNYDADNNAWNFMPMSAMTYISFGLWSRHENDTYSCRRQIQIQQHGL